MSETATGRCGTWPKWRANALPAKIPVLPDTPSLPAACDPKIVACADDLHQRCVAPQLRILSVTQSYYPFLQRGGPAVKVRAMARGLARRGHQVTVLTSDLGIQEAATPGTISREPGGWRFDEDGVKAFYLSARSSYRSLTWNPGAFAFCTRWLKSVDIAHIYGTYDLLGPIVARACRQMEIPYLLEPMGMFRPMVRNLALKWLYRRLLGESVVRGAARLVATSPQERRELIEEGISPERIIIRRNGVESPANSVLRGAFRRQWRIPEKALLVLFLGRMVSKKSPELLLEAFTRWQRSQPTSQPAVLVFAGPAENSVEMHKLEAKVSPPELGKTVLFTGALYGDAKWSALLDADVFVLPSQNENFGNAAAEAVACGTPVIVTDRCGVAPLIDRRAGLVIPHDSDALVRALHQLNDDCLRERMKVGCAEVARGLGWEQPLAETEMLYAELLREQNEAREQSFHQGSNTVNVEAERVAETVMRPARIKE